MFWTTALIVFGCDVLTIMVRIIKGKIVQKMIWKETKIAWS